MTNELSIKKPTVPAPVKEKGKAPAVPDKALASEMVRATGTSSPKPPDELLP
jgi:hypothetical protein